MADYTPTTDEMRAFYTAERLDGPHLDGFPPPTVEQAEAEFDRWLAAHDAEVRSSVVAGEPEWEYGFTSNWGTFAARDQISAEQQAATIRTEIKAGRSSGDVKYHGRVMKRTKAEAGPWVPAEQEDRTTKHEIRRQDHA